jgi:hypothetical protein
MSGQANASTLAAGIVPLHGTDQNAKSSPSSGTLTLWLGRTGEGGRSLDNPNELLEAFVREVEKSSAFFNNVIKVPCAK